MRIIAGIIFYVMITQTMGCKEAGKIETCGSPYVVRDILKAGGLEIEDYKVEVRDNMCILKVKSQGGKELKVFYSGGHYFIGIGFDEKGKMIE